MLFKRISFFLIRCQTDGSVPNTLVIANCEVVKPRVAAAEHISQVFVIGLIFCMQLNSSVNIIINYFIFSPFNEEARSPFVKKYKTIIHPGEV